MPMHAATTDDSTKTPLLVPLRTAMMKAFLGKGRVRSGKEADLKAGPIFF